jgi:lipid II:glycine glycyltransferase (peptidoglycan interpeptide bridge formation enzyme)
MTPEAAGGRARPRRPRVKAEVAPPPKVPAVRAKKPAVKKPAAKKPGPAVLPPIEDLIAAARPRADGPEPRAEEAPEPEVSASTDPLKAHLATEDELAGWDTKAVGSPSGHVYQSRAWADFRAAHGWRTWNIVFDDGFRLLVIGSPAGSRNGGNAYASRGPIPEPDPAISAMRAAIAADLVAAEGLGTLTVDSETPAAGGLGAHLVAAGFAASDEEQPSRHRMDVQLGPDDAPNSDEKTIFGSFGATTRNAIRQAERHGLRVRRLDAGGGRLEEESGASELAEFEPVEPYDQDATQALLQTFYEMLDESAKQRAFALSSEDRFVDWSRQAIAAGHLVYLQAEHAEDGPIAGAAFYRHGHRLTYALAGDRADERRKYPGAVPLLVWRGIQIALDERRMVVDLGGVDVPGARGKPDKGDPTYEPYQFRESFGARWVELTGAHRRTMRPSRRSVGRAAASALRLLGRSPR